jgi:hypothetical protein
MSLTLTDISKMSECEIASMLELDPAKALEFVTIKLSEFEAEHQMSTKDMLRQYNPDKAKVEDWMEDWHDLVVMQLDLIDDKNARTKV